jgi:hypothetical protein
MKVTTLFYAVKARGASVLKRHPLLHVAGVVILVALATPYTVLAQEVAAPLPGVLGNIQTITATSFEVQTKTGVVHVNIRQPLTTYKQIPSDLSHVTSTSFVGLVSVELPDGTQQAQHILLFPPELRGAAEGSVVMDAAPDATTHSRMTNGSISRPVASQSRMTNGTVQKGSDTTLVVRYQGGAQTVSVPPNVGVTEAVRAKVTLAVGDRIYAATEKLPDGTLTTSKIFLADPAPSHNTGQ